MKIIDEKGRLFGKINIIDFVVVIFLLSLTPMVYFGYNIFNKKNIEVRIDESLSQTQQRPKRESVTVIVAGKLIKIKPEMVKSINVGDQEFNSDGDLIGEIITLGEISPCKYNVDIGCAKELTIEDSRFRDVLVRLKINAEIKGRGIYYKNTQIVNTGTLDFSPKKYSVEMENLKIIEGSSSMPVLVNNSLTENLEIKLDSGFKVLTDKITELENKIDYLVSRKILIN